MVFAHYSTFSLSGDGKHFNMLWVGGESNDFEVDDIYIRLHDGKTHNLRLLTEDNAKEWIAREPNPTVRELRGYPETRLRCKLILERNMAIVRHEAAEECANRRDADHRLARFNSPLVVFAQAA